MSEVKVNKISPRSGTGVTLGDSGDTFTIPSGATINNQGTAVNFGATGSASWVTTVKTGDFTAVAGEGYFVDTTSQAITVTLPASPSAGAVVAVKDYANTWDTNNCTLGRNGSNIGGTALNSTLGTEGLAVTLVFVDATKGWLVTDSGLQSEAPGPTFVAATGGTESIVCTNYKVHTFTGPGTFTVSCGGNAAGSNTVSYMVVAGGGAGGVKRGGGAGGGGFREGRTAQCSSWTASPIACTSGANAGLPVSAQAYAIEVGGGGTVGVGANPICNPASTANTNGIASSFSTITSAGGGAGGGTGTPTGAGAPGASGGGGVHSMSGRPSPAANAFGTGNTPPTSPAQGTNGGSATQPEPAGTGGGGGGATVVGTDGGDGQSTGPGSGGAGATTNINGSPVAYSGGGGGGARPNGSQALGGTGGGGRGANCAPNPWAPGGSSTGESGTINTGGGGGGTGDSPGANSGGGGSGIVIIRYRFQ